MSTTGSPSTDIHRLPGRGAPGGPVSARCTAGVLAALALVTAACGSTAEARQTPVRTAPTSQQVSVRDAGPAPCLASADAVQHWSEGAGGSACVLALRERARVRLGFSVEPSSSSTWVCPTTADAAEHWVRALGVAGCRR